MRAAKLMGELGRLKLIGELGREVTGLDGREKQPERRGERGIGRMIVRVVTKVPLSKTSV